MAGGDEIEEAAAQIKEMSMEKTIEYLRIVLIHDNWRNILFSHQE